MGSRFVAVTRAVPKRVLSSHSSELREKTMNGFYAYGAESEKGKMCGVVKPHLYL